MRKSFCEKGIILTDRHLCDALDGQFVVYGPFTKSWIVHICTLSFLYLSIERQKYLLL